jgi:hypothetical protein
MRSPLRGHETWFKKRSMSRFVSARFCALCEVFAVSKLVIILFTLAWAAVIFLIVRALVTVWRKDRNLAAASSLAVAAAFVGGALAPFSLWMRPAPAPVAAAPAAAGVPAVAGAIVCTPGAKIAAGSAQGHIDAASVAGASVPVPDLTSVKPGQRVELSGWIVASGAALANGVCVISDGHPIAMQGKYGLDRPDVGAALGKPEDRGAGVDVAFALAPGSHTVQIGVVEADGKTIHLLDQPLHIVSH